MRGLLKTVKNRLHRPLPDLLAFWCFLAWLIAQPQSNAIAGVRHAEQASQNAKAADVKLTTEDTQKIDEIGRLVTNHLDNNPVMWDWDS